MNKSWKTAIILMQTAVLMSTVTRALPLSAAGTGYLIEIVKSEQVLNLKRGNHTLQSFKIAYGKGDRAPKRKRGDNRTPIGNYQVLDFKSDSKFHYFMQINYPNMIDAWHGYKDRLISPAEYKQIAISFKNQEMPPQDTALGGYIGIHGLGEITDDKIKIHAALNWTEGCIALTNDEINILRKYVTKGTPVLIRE